MFLCRLNRFRRVSVMGAVASVALSAVGWSAPVRSVEMPAGTVIPVRLEDKLSSKSSRVGDRFTVIVQNDRDYYSQLPRGTRIEGYVSQVKKASKDRPGMLDLRFRSISFQGDRSYNIQGVLVGLNSVDRSRDGRLIAKGRQDETLNTALFGAVGGFILGSLGKKPLEGTLIGAAAGYLYGRSQAGKQKYHEVDLRQGSEFGVRLDRSIVFRTDVSYNPGNNDWDRDDRDWDRDDRDNWDRDDRGNWDRDDRNPYDWDRDDDGYYIERQPLDLYIDGKRLNLSGNRRAYYQNDDVMLPLDAVLDKLDIDYDYNAESKSVVIRSEEGPVRARVGESRITVDGRSRDLDGMLKLVDGRLFVPAELIEIASDYDVEFDRDDHEVRIDD